MIIWKPLQLRWPWLARVSRGRFGMGRWTAEEIEAVNARARARYERLRKHWED